MAIIAVDEAKVIADERGITGVEQKDRPVPVFVEGEYRTQRDPKDGGATVRITLCARNADKVLLARKLEAVPLDQAGGQLLTVFTKDLAGLTCGGVEPIDLEAQYRLLTRRADDFSSIGEFRRSAALREAALLLKPGSDEQRIQLVREYARRNRSPVEFDAWPKGAQQDEKDSFWMAEVVQTVSDWKRSLQHCEYLIRNRRLCREEATDLTYNAIHSITGVRSASTEQMNECEALKKEFLRQAFTRIASLDTAARMGRRGLFGALDVYHSIFECSLMRCDGNYYAEDDLDLIADLLLNRLPDSMLPSHVLNFFLERAGAGICRKEEYYRFTEQQYLLFLDHLSSSKRPLARIYGRYGKFCYRCYGKNEKSPELLQEAKDIVAEAEKAGFDLRQHDYFMGQLWSAATCLSQGLEPKAPAVTQAVRPVPPKHVLQPILRVSLELIELTFAGGERNSKKLSPEISWSAPGGSGGVSRYRPLGEGLDALWSSGAVLFMRQPGKVTQVLADAKLSVDDVITDGRYVWVAASYEWGISVLDRDGKELIRIAKEQGLPPCDRFGMVVCPLGPGRVLASGSFGNEHCGWIAIVEFDGAKPKVEVIHEAIKAWDYKRNDNYRNLDPSMCFTPEAAFEHRVLGPNPQRIVFILRHNTCLPLLVDPDNKKVWVYPATDQGFPRTDPSDEAFLSIDGVLWIAGADCDLSSYRLNEETGLFQVVRKRPRSHPGNVRDGSSSRDGSLARDGDFLYFAAYFWRRINLRTGEEELLVDDPSTLPDYGNGRAWRIARSDLYGLVTFRHGKLYRIRIKEKEPSTNH